MSAKRNDAGIAEGDTGARQLEAGQDPAIVTDSGMIADGAIAPPDGLVDLTRASPSIDPKFPNTPTDAFWSASPYVGSPDRGWIVNFSVGLATSEDVSTPRLVRCVR